MYSTPNRRAVLALGISTLSGCVAHAGSEQMKSSRLGQVSSKVRGEQHDRWEEYDPQWSAPTTSPEVPLKTETVIENLEIPWDISFASNGELFITERTGRIIRFEEERISHLDQPPGVIDARAVPRGSKTREWFVEGGEGGTMGVAVHPRYPDRPYIYLYYTSTGWIEPVNRLARFDVSNSDPWEILLEIPGSSIHNGGRIAFGPDDRLWVTTGDAGHGNLAQAQASLSGKVLRLTAEGDPDPGNPTLGRNAHPAIFTLGHRNPQGITWTPDGLPIVSEHGPASDEINVLNPGGNYGWPDVHSPKSYEGTNMVAPVASSNIERTTWAPAGANFYTGDKVHHLKNRLLTGCLRRQRLKIFTLTPRGDTLPRLGETGTRHDANWLSGVFTVTSYDALVNELGRIRHIEQSPTGELFALTSNRDGRARGPFPRKNDDRLVRIIDGN